jgi:broad specificity phosphatase PhoE
VKNSARQVVWICRHGARIDFLDPSWKGHDPHLSPDGVVQARETGVRLRDEGIQHIFASPFLRAVETAHLIADAVNLSVKIEQGLCEWLNPDWFTERPRFLSLEELSRRFSRVDPSYQSAVIPRYPETGEESSVRAGQAACLLANTHKGDMLLVSHGHAVIGMTLAVMGQHCSFSTGLCALIKITRHDGSSLLELAGDCSHLSGGEQHAYRFV